MGMLLVCFPGRGNWFRTSWCENHVHIEPNQIAHCRQQQLWFEIGIADLDADGFPDRISGLSETQ